ncbi:cold-shock' DNA-binding domain-domain-containing protein [Leucosporidium creatinivorum]|uniref:Cold-shock' DNA-binding domain-domain-containing protein n=1 Tax=Leucosporidium creatinivorum TaxID=106004 RepID=A0A1Y2F8P2_9BASI|nr:cold-shock' DNA-binding domain-domain-containing protein [Leucosporidium creatinivorum]
MATLPPPNHSLSALDLQFDRLSLGGQNNMHQLPHQILPVNKLDIPRRRGIVKFFNSLKGFGFVVDNDPGALGGQEVFCHFSAISGKGGFRSLAEGEEVEYELVQGPKGFQAANLTGPGGRTVVGDPKARLAKPPPYMPFAPLAMPISGSYLADPYQQQHPGVYAASPYTQHIVYVPSTVAIPSSQYAYAHPGGPGAQIAGGMERGSGSPYGGRGAYQSYAPPGPIIGGPYATLASASTGGAAQGYGQAQLGVGAGPGGANGAAGGGASRSASAGSFGLPQSFSGSSSPPTQTSSFGFAPFSPPTFNNAPLFPSGNGPSFHSPPSNSPPTSTYNLPQSSSRNSSGNTHGSGAFPSSQNGTSSTSNSSGSALFGAGPGPLAIGTIGGGPGSRAGTPGERRSTPGLGNGTITGGSSDWKAPILYASGGSDFA